MAKKQKTKKLYPKEWSKKHIFHSYLFIFLRKPKRMLKFLQDGLWNSRVQEIMDKKVSLKLKPHFSVSDHVTLGVVRWRHKLNHTCPQWMLSKFGPMKAYMCWVTANSFLPSNGLRRYCNGPLTINILCPGKIYSNCMEQNPDLTIFGSMIFPV